VAGCRAVERGEDAGRDVVGADRLHVGGAAPGQGIDRRDPERRRRERRLRHGGLRKGLGAVRAQRVMRRGAERRHEHEPLDARTLGAAQEPPRREAVELLQPCGGLVAPRTREVDDRAHAAQGVAERGGIGEVAQRDLHPHAGRPEPARVAHEATHRVAARLQARQQRRSDPSGGAGEQEHGPGA
jgi:hypothetical protein